MLIYVIALVSASLAAGMLAFAFTQWPGMPGWLTDALPYFLRDPPLARLLYEPGVQLAVLALLAGAVCWWLGRGAPRQFARADDEAIAAFAEPAADRWRRATIGLWLFACFVNLLSWPYGLKTSFYILSTRPPTRWPGNPVDQAMYGVGSVGITLLVVTAILGTAAVYFRRGFRTLGPGGPGILLGVIIATADCLLVTISLFIAVAANNP